LRVTPLPANPTRVSHGSAVGLPVTTSARTAVTRAHAACVELAVGERGTACKLEAQRGGVEDGRVDDKYTRNDIAAEQ